MAAIVRTLLTGRSLSTRATAVRIEEAVGLITCVIEKVDKRTGLARFALPNLPVSAGDTITASARR